MAITYLIDSNILIYASVTNSPYQKLALEIMNKVIAGNINACLSYQTLYEFYAIITDRKRKGIFSEKYVDDALHVAIGREGFAPFI